MKTNELAGAQLDYWTARSDGWTFGPPHKIHGWDVWRNSAGEIVGTVPAHAFKPSSEWAHGGPLIEREKIATECPRGGQWVATIWTGNSVHRFIEGTGDTLLVAAMRCYVMSKFGAEVPDETGSAA